MFQCLFRLKNQKCKRHKKPKVDLTPFLKRGDMDSDTKLPNFSHPELNLQVTAIGGNYVLLKEVRLPFNDEEILYLVGMAIFDTTCCGTGGCAYALVPGFIRQWQYKTDANSRPVSQVKHIGQERLRKKIREMIFKKEAVHQIDFM
jgi:hypothetical protein